MESEKLCENCGWVGIVANATKKCPKCENKSLIPKCGSLILKEQKDSQIIEIKNLIVSPQPRRRIALGRAKEFMDLIERKPQTINSIIWNEGGISLFTDEANTELMFTPEYHPASKIFFNPCDNRNQDMFSDDFGKRIWEGEFESVQFGKRALLKFLDKYADYFDDEIKEAVKNLRVSQKRSSQTEMLSLDTKSERTVEEYHEDTNLPSKFTALMPLFENIKVELHFEAKVVKKEDRYGNAGNKNVIEVRCINSKEALRDAMENLVSQMPEGIPKYYGAMHTSKPSKY